MCSGYVMKAKKLPSDQVEIHVIFSKLIFIERNVVSLLLCNNKTLNSYNNYASVHHSKLWNSHAQIQCSHIQSIYIDYVDDDNAEDIEMHYYYYTINETL